MQTNFDIYTTCNLKKGNLDAKSQNGGQARSNRLKVALLPFCAPSRLSTLVKLVILHYFYAGRIFVRHISFSKISFQQNDISKTFSPK